MQTAKEAREARRKRILERGSDRLAYITGDASKQQSLKASPISPPRKASLFAEHTSVIPDSQPAEGLRSGFHDSQSDEDFQQFVPDSQLARTSPEPFNMMPAVLSGGFLGEPMATVSSTAAKKCHTTSVKYIVQSIEASEGLQALAAALVAVFVVMESVLSCCGHPWGHTLAVFLPRWPLGLVFVTDFTIVIGAYIFHSQVKSSRKGVDRSFSQSEGLDGSFDKISKALDVVGQFEDLLNLGLLCKKAAGAITLDCSVYVVTLVCGFSICNYLSSCCRCY